MDGEKIQYNRDGKLNVPDQPIIPYIEGDGVGSDIWRASVKLFNAAVKKCYGVKRKVHWLEVYAGEKAFHLKQEWAPEETIEAIREYKIGIKGPLTTPVGGGIRSINVLPPTKTRSLCLHSACKIHPRNAESIKASGESGHGGFS